MRVVLRLGVGLGLRRGLIDAAEVGLLVSRDEQRRVGVHARLGRVDDLLLGDVVAHRSHDLLALGLREDPSVQLLAPVTAACVSKAKAGQRGPRLVEAGRGLQQPS